jgi:hypothetical protein
MVFQINGISTEKKHTAEKMHQQLGMFTPNKFTSGQKGSSHLNRNFEVTPPPKAIRNLNNMFQAFDSGTKNLQES